MDHILPARGRGYLRLRAHPVRRGRQGHGIQGEVTFDETGRNTVNSGFYTMGPEVLI